MLGPLTFLDAILLGIALISGILAMYRGLTREVLSILSWALAAGAAVFFAFFYREISVNLANSLGIDKTIALALCLIAIFLIILIVVHFITSKFSDTVLDSRVGALDRTLGFIFGLGRGFILVVILYFFGSYLEPKVENHPKWVTESHSLPYILNTKDFGTNIMKKYMPDKIELPDLNSNTDQQS